MRKPTIAAFVLIGVGFVVITLSAFTLNEGQESDRHVLNLVAFTGVNVIPMDSERILEKQTVLVKNRKIAEIGPASKVELPQDVFQIDGQGKYLLPGLADMHVHLMGNDTDELLLYVANGVTAVRNMWGNPSHLEWRKQIAAGDLLGPTIYTAGPIMDGNPPYWPGSLVVEKPEDAEKEVAAQKQAGYDAIKVYWYLRPEVYQAILTAAKKHNLPVWGHVPFQVGLEKAIGGGQYSFEHMLDFVYALLPDESPARAALIEFSQGQGDRNKLIKTIMIDPYQLADRDKVPALIAKAAASKDWICPTLVVTRKLAASPEEFEGYRNHPSMRYVSPQLVGMWKMFEKIMLEVDVDPEVKKQGVKLELRLVKELHKAGARLIAGTDNPNSYLVPGYSVLEELQLFVEAGLTPYEAIKATTRDAADSLGKSDEFGTIAAGKRADLVLVDANPLENVANIAKRAGVMVQGQWLPESELKDKLETLAMKYVKR